MESHGVLVWSTGTKNWYGEVVRKPGSFQARVETWQNAVWILAILMEHREKSVWKVSLMEHHEELVDADVDTLMEYHEKSESWGIVTPAEFCWHIRGSVVHLYSTNETDG